LNLGGYDFLRLTELGQSGRGAQLFPRRLRSEPSRLPVKAGLSTHPVPEKAPGYIAEGQPMEAESRTRTPACCGTFTVAIWGRKTGRTAKLGQCALQVKPFGLTPLGLWLGAALGLMAFPGGGRFALGPVWPPDPSRLNRVSGSPPFWPVPAALIGVGIDGGGAGRREGFRRA